MWYPPCFVLVKLDWTKATQLEGLEEHVVPIISISKTFTITINGQKQKIMRFQLPMTAAYAFTDYCAQGQTINPALLNIAPPPSGILILFNTYVALLWGQSCKTIQLLWDVDDKILTQHLSEFLRLEDERLDELDKITKQWWEQKNRNTHENRNMCENS